MIYKIKYIVAILCLPILLCGLHIVTIAQTHKILYTSYKVGDDIIANQITAMVQDRYGFLWLATDKSIVRFDGQGMTYYDETTEGGYAYTGKYANEMLCDTKGNIWILTYRSGLYLFDYTTERFYHYAIQDNSQTSKLFTDTRDIYLDANNYLLVATEGEGIFGLDLNNPLSYNPQTANFEHYTTNNTQLASNLVFSFATASRANSIWVASGNQVYIAKLNTDKTYTFEPITEIQAPAIAETSHIHVVFEDRSKQLWIGYANGCLARYDIEKKQMLVMQTSHTTTEYVKNKFLFGIWQHIQQDNKGDVWLNSFTNGLWKYDTTNDTLIHFSAQHQNFDISFHPERFAFFFDNQQNFWLGINGLLKIKKQEKFTTIVTAKNGGKLRSSSIRAFYPDKQGNIWVGGYGALDKVNPTDFSVTPIKYSNSNSEWNMYAMCGDPLIDNRIWIGCDGQGLAYFDQNNAAITKVFSENDKTANKVALAFVYEIIPDTLQFVWIGHQNGFSRFDTQKHTFTDYKNTDTNETSGIMGGAIKALLKVPDGKLWIGSDADGLHYFDTASRKYTSFRHNDQQADALSSNSVLCIYKSSDQTLWVGTSNGLNKLENFDSKQFKIYTKKHGLPDNTVYGILEDAEHNLWLSTNQGIACFNPATETVFNYNQADGLQDNEFNTAAFLKLQNGQMFFGGINGFSAFFPDQIQKKVFSPPIFFTNLKLYNKTVRVGDTINQRVILKKAISVTDTLILNYNQDYFALEVAALDYQHTDKIHYSYQLEHWNDQWFELDQNTRTISFNNLSPDEYILHVKATSSNQHDQAQEAVLHIHILPPWWQTWWALTLMYSFLPLLFIGFYTWRLAILKSQKHLLEQQVEARTTQIVLQNKQLQSQTLILNKTYEKLQETTAFKEMFSNMLVHDLKNMLNTVLFFSTNKQVIQAGHQMMNMVMSILNIQQLKTKKLELHKEPTLCQNMINQALEQVALLISDKNIRIENNTPQNLTLYLDPDLVVRLLVNLLTNAIRYSAINGIIRFDCVYEHDFAVISITDHGQGIAPEKLNAIFDEYVSDTEGRKQHKYSTGLGLSFCKLVTEAHGGKIAVTSQLQKGTTISFSLPLVTEQVAPTNHPTQKIPTQLILSPDDRKTIAPLITQLQTIEIFEVTTIYKLINELLAQQVSDKVQQWCYQLQQGVQNCNSQLYDQLRKL